MLSFLSLFKGRASRKITSYLRITVWSVLFFASTDSLLAQNLVECMYPLPPAPQYKIDFSHFDHAAMAVEDVDNDGDMDLMITGRSFYDIEAR